MVKIATLTLNPALDVATITPKIRPTHKLRCADPLYDAGGGGINVARGLYALGEEAIAIFPSGGPPGDMICRLLGAAHISFAPVPIAGLTRQSFAVTEGESDAQYRFVLPGPVLTEEAQRDIFERIFAIGPQLRYLVISGSIPPGITQHFFARLHDVCTALNIHVLLDSSGQGLAMSRGLKALLVKPSLSELEAMAGCALPDDDSRIAAARKMIADGHAENVLLSLGEQGALLIDSQENHCFASPTVTVVSGIGAGDSMVAAVTWALAHDWPLIDAARYGVAAGAAALMSPATRLFRKADADRLHREMK
ncbi:1-phosphofructokinase family hexose kinase [Stakelama sp. CBK3Z-3]|uniref:Phosphofructokinase n=1 Tax=Stakelama flava TaxID=2860338 RepID=A0ABS6XKS3_9SPHN|nr:1-phosphofructokinase family hexose kinase [Stakelama flava]MBW4330815.1 1-phosphofructokinase family hexose kinase [Stakelama flava]